MGVFCSVFPRNTGVWAQPDPVKVAGSEQLRGFLPTNAAGCFHEDTDIIT